MNVRFTRQMTAVLAFTMLLAGSGCKPKKSVQKKDFTQEKSVGAIFGKTASVYGVTQVHLGFDGTNAPATIGGKECTRMMPRGDRSDCYLYFKIDPSFKTNGSINLKVSVEYFDATPTELDVEYDSWNEHGKKQGAYTASPEKLILTGDQQWKTADFTLSDARLEGRQNSGADMRIRSSGGECFVRSVSISRE